MNNSNNHNYTIKEKITYFKGKNNNFKKKYKNYKTLTTTLKSFDTFVIFATTSSSIAFSPTGLGLIVKPLSTGIASGSSIGNNVMYEIIINKYNKYKKPYEKDQRTIKPFDKLIRKSLQDNIINKT